MNGKFLPSSIEVGTVHGSAARSDMIWISVDRLSLILHERSASISERRAWQTPCGLFVAIATTLCTSEFKQTFGLPAATWQAFFMFCGVVSFIWLARELLKLSKLKSIDDLVAEITSRADGPSLSDERIDRPEKG